MTVRDPPPDVSGMSGTFSPGPGSAAVNVNFASSRAGEASTASASGLPPRLAELASVDFGFLGPSSVPSPARLRSGTDRFCVRPPLVEDCPLAFPPTTSRQNTVSIRENVTVSHHGFVSLRWCSQCVFLEGSVLQARISRIRGRTSTRTAITTRRSRDQTATAQVDRYQASAQAKFGLTAWDDACSPTLLLVCLLGHRR